MNTTTTDLSSNGPVKVVFFNKKADAEAGEKAWSTKDAGQIPGKNFYPVALVTSNQIMTLDSSLPFDLNVCQKAQEDIHAVLMDDIVAKFARRWPTWNTELVKVVAKTSITRPYGGNEYQLCQAAEAALAAAAVNYGKGPKDLVESFQEYLGTALRYLVGTFGFRTHVNLSVDPLLQFDEHVIQSGNDVRYVLARQWVRGLSPFRVRELRELLETRYRTYSYDLNDAYAQRTLHWFRFTDECLNG